MNWKYILAVYLKELKDSLRDRRTLISVIVIPTFVMPLLFFGVAKIGSTVVSKARSEVPSIMLLGGADSPGVTAELKASKRLRVVETAENWKQLVSEKKIRAVVELPDGFEAGLKSGAAANVTIYHYEGELKSGIAAGEAEKFLRELRERTITDRLRERDLPATLVKPFDFKRQNVAPPEKVGGNIFGGMVPYIIIILCFTGAMYPAMDLTAGEKERGTMETLLCSPVARVNLVLGKFLMVLTGSLSAIALSLMSMGISVVVAGFVFGGNAGGAKAAAAAAGGGAQGLPTIDPLGLFGVLGMVFPVAVFFSAIIFTVALFAKSFKEAQSYIGPMIFVVIMPAVVGILPGIDLNLKLALVPILNLSLVCKEMLSGVWHWDYIAIIFGSSCVYAAIALALAVRMFNREDVIFRA
jgi:sodium transport system permease protein